VIIPTCAQQTINAKTSIRILVLLSPGGETIRQPSRSRQRMIAQIGWAEKR
jgi:hypothetical protein